MLKACIGLKQVELVDRRHCGLTAVPEDVYRHERTLEELLLDFNAIQDLPPRFFRLTALRKVTLCENDLNRIPPGIANLIRLVELDISKNAIEDIPTNMQFCRSLHVLDISSNPLLRTPESVSSISSLTHLCINDVAIPRLPAEIGNLENLAVLEARENTIKMLPVSIAKLKKLKRLDVGNNEIEVMPEEIGELRELTELWLDTNLILELPETLTKLRNLMALDVTKNRLERLPANFSSLSRLSDLHLSENCLEILPEDFGKLRALTLIKLDLNHLVSLPDSIGDLNLVTELLLFDNMLDTIPSSLFKMRSLEMLNLDRNHLIELPNTVGECKSLHVLSLRENELYELPEELGYLPRLKVLDIVNNRIRSLPLSFGELNLDAFWIDGSQPQPLIVLEVQPNPDNSEMSNLSCCYLPQGGPTNSSMENFLEDSSETSDPSPNNFHRTGSFGKGVKLGVAFDPSLGPAPDDPSSKLVRFPTPFRKDLKALKAKRKKGKYKPEAMPSTTIFRKGSISSKDDLTVIPSDSVRETQQDSSYPSMKKEKSHESLGDFSEIVEKWGSGTTPNGTSEVGLTEYDREPSRKGSGLMKMTGLENLSMEDVTEEDKGTPEPQNDLKSNSDDSAELPSGSVVRSIDVTIEFEKVPGRTLGFSIAGGRGSTPAYEDVDDSIYVTKIAPDGLAEQDGRLRLGDKLLSVNNINMINATHAESVDALKSITTFCKLVVSREVLVVLPEDTLEEVEEEVEDKERAVSPSTLPMPTAKLTFSDGEATSGESDGGEGVAKKIVADVMDRSIKRVTSEEEMVNEEEAPSQQHDNYINFNIAQILAKESRKEDPQDKPPEDDSPLHSLKKSEEVKSIHRQTRPSISMSIDDEDESYPEERVILDRSIGKLGLSIVGGADHVSRVFGQGKPGVYISKISNEGAAKATGKLRLGDRILEVNKFNVRFSTHQQAVQWLISQEGDIELLVQHVPQPHGLQQVHLKKKGIQKLGLSIRGGGKGSKGNPLDQNDEGIFISKIAKGGAAECDGRLAVGMRIVEVNGISLLGASHSMAVKVLKISNDLFITVCDGFDPQEVLRRKSLADTDSYYVPLSASNSLMFNSSLFGESVDGMAPHAKKERSQSAIIPPMFSVMNSKLSLSSTAINNNLITTEEDFDSLIDDLAKFKMEESQQMRRASSPPSISIPLSDIIGPLQNGGLMPMEDDAFEQEVGLMEEPPVETETSDVVLQDTSSMLAELDSELITMHEDVLQGEDEMRRSTENLLLGDDDLTPKAKRRFTKSLKIYSPANPSDASPETRRRAEQIRINISPPPDAEASEAAVQSIIGEVFNDISFEEFETKTASPWSGQSSGIISPFSDRGRSMSPDSSKTNMQELLSALKGIGSPSALDTKEQSASSESVESSEPNFGAVPPPKDRAKTMPATLILSVDKEDSAPKVTLRVSTATNNPDKRKSAPPEIKSPENLTFKEKLALYKNITPPSSSSRSHHSSSELLSDAATTKPPRSISSVTSIPPPPPPVNRTALDEKPSSPTSPKELLPTTLSDRIAFLRSNQTKAGMQPVDVKTSVTAERRLLAEEKRIERILKKDNQMDSQDVNHASHHTDHDSSQKLIPSNANSNNSNNNSNTTISSSTDSIPVHNLPDDPDNAEGRESNNSERHRERQKTTELNTKQPLDSGSQAGNSKKKTPITLV